MLDTTCMQFFVCAWHQVWDVTVRRYCLWCCGRICTQVPLLLWLSAVMVIFGVSYASLQGLQGPLASQVSRQPRAGGAVSRVQTVPVLKAIPSHSPRCRTWHHASCTACRAHGWQEACWHSATAQTRPFTEPSSSLSCTCCRGITKPCFTEGLWCWRYACKRGRCCALGPAQVQQQCVPATMSTGMHVCLQAPVSFNPVAPAAVMQNPALAGELGVHLLRSLSLAAASAGPM